MLPHSVGDWHGDCQRRSMTALSGAYFVGSIALGGYVANGSDVDIVGVSERDAPGSWSSVASSSARGLAQREAWSSLFTERTWLELRQDKLTSSSTSMEAHGCPGQSISMRVPSRG